MHLSGLSGRRGQHLANRAPFVLNVPTVQLLPRVNHRSRRFAAEVEGSVSERDPQRPDSTARQLAEHDGGLVLRHRRSDAYCGCVLLPGCASQPVARRDRHRHGVLAYGDGDATFGGEMGARRVAATVSNTEVLAFVIMPVVVTGLGWLLAWLGRRYIP